MNDLTREARCAAAEKIVREQRQLQGWRSWKAELERLQAAVMGEDQPAAEGMAH